MATTKEPEPQRAVDPNAKRPGMEPGARFVPDQAEKRYGPQEPVAVPGSFAALKAELRRELLAELKGESVAADASREVEEANRRERERQERRAKDQAERTARLSLYRAAGNDPQKIAGEIPAEQPGMGRRTVRQGEQFRFAGIPSPDWMIPLDDESKRKVEDERRRRERIQEEAATSRLGVESLKLASDLMERLTQGRERQAAGGHEHRAGAGG